MAGINVPLYALIAYAVFVVIGSILAGVLPATVNLPDCEPGSRGVLLEQAGEAATGAGFMDSPVINAVNRFVKIRSFEGSITDRE